MTSAARVVVTGTGVISALGDDRHQFWAALSQGRSGIRPIESVDCTGLRFSNGAEVRDFDSAAHLEPKQVDQMDRFAQFGFIAAREAVADSGIAWTDDLRERTAIVTGSCLGGRVMEHAVISELHAGTRSRVPPLTIPRGMENCAASQISIAYGIVGPVYTVTTACSSSNHAIGQAFHLVRSGAVQAGIAGGSESPFTLEHLRMWEALRAVSPDTCRPFCRDRKGMILGEGGAMLMLESLEGALARGAHIYAEISGYGASSDAHHITHPQAEGGVRAMRGALRDARIDPQAVNYINAHGTGTAANDTTETTAIRSVFGSHADNVAVSATKSMHGHALGAASALEAVATVLALHNDLLPPTANFTSADPLCDLDVIANEAREQRVEYALSNSFAFGGLNATLVFRRWDGDTGGAA